MRRTPTHTARAVLGTLAALATLALTACEQAEDAVAGAANDAACSVARSAVDEAGQQAGDAVDKIGADPQAAERELRGVRDALAAAEQGVDGDVRARLVEAKTSVETLLGQAQDAAQGAEVDTTVVDDARAELDRSVEDVKSLC